jgi:long-chain acyl-CoA synthetase
MFQRIWHKHYPKQVPVEIDFEKITLPDILTRTAARFADRPAIYYEGMEISYGRLDELVNRMARSLKNMGVKKGERVAVLLPNIPQVIIACQAILRIGAVTAMNNPLYTESELTYQLNDTGAGCLITSDDNLQKALNLRKSTGIKTIITSGFDDLDLQNHHGSQTLPALPSGVYRLMEIIDSASSAPMPNEAKWDAVANIIYTGGTTGVSKGVMLTHANLSCNLQQYSRWMHNTIDGQESWPLVYPIYHSAGYTMHNTSIYAGWKMILVSKPTPEILAKIIKNTKPSLLPGVSTIFVGLLACKEFQELDLSHIKAFMTGGGPPDGAHTKTA